MINILLPLCRPLNIHGESMELSLSPDADDPATPVANKRNSATEHQIGGTTPGRTTRHEWDLTPQRRPGLLHPPVVKLHVRYDFGWDKRGNGYKYDSHSGRASMIGEHTGKLLGYDTVSSYCAMCARGHNPANHKCAKNYEGSSKGATFSS